MYPFEFKVAMKHFNEVNRDTVGAATRSCSLNPKKMFPRGPSYKLENSSAYIAYFSSSDPLKHQNGAQSLYG